MIDAIANSPFTHFLHSQLWLPQLLETIHMISHSLLVGAAVLIALRLIGFGSKIPLVMLTRYLLPACWLALGFVVLSGGLLFVMGIKGYVLNPFFLWTMAAALEGVVFLVILQVVTQRFGDQWENGGAVPVPVQLLAGASVSVWIAAVIFGRFIYTAL
jgi:hypothetical protein